jgi:hypothetical protein
MELSNNDQVELKTKKKTTLFGKYNNATNKSTSLEISPRMQVSSEKLV